MVLGRLVWNSGPRRERLPTLNAKHTVTFHFTLLAVATLVIDGVHLVNIFSITKETCSFLTKILLHIYILKITKKIKIIHHQLMMLILKKTQLIQHILLGNKFLLIFTHYGGLPRHYHLQHRIICSYNSVNQTLSSFVSNVPLLRWWSSNHCILITIKLWTLLDYVPGANALGNGTSRLLPQNITNGSSKKMILIYVYPISFVGLPAPWCNVTDISTQGERPNRGAPHHHNTQKAHADARETCSGWIQKSCMLQYSWR